MTGVVCYNLFNEICNDFDFECPSLSLANPFLPPGEDCDKPGNCCHGKCVKKNKNLSEWEKCMMDCASGKI